MHIASESGMHLRGGNNSYYPIHYTVHEQDAQYMPEAIGNCWSVSQLTANAVSMQGSQRLCFDYVRTYVHTTTYLRYP